MRVERFAGAVVPAKMWTDGVPVEPQALEQIKATASLPFIHGHVAVMPDVHLGIGATVGTVIPTKGAIVPAAVGVDIGCGMIGRADVANAHDLPDHLRDMRNAIEARRAARPTDHGGQQRPRRPVAASCRRARSRSWIAGLDRDPHRRPRRRCGQHRQAARHARHRQPLHRAVPRRGRSCLGHAALRVARHRQPIGTLLHRSSPQGGRAAHLVACRIATWRTSGGHASTSTTMSRDALGAGLRAQEPRADDAGRFWRRSSEALGRPGVPGCRAVNCHHNYCEREHHFGEDVWVTRKGAVRRRGDLGIIPGSHGRAALHRPRSGQPRVVPLVQPWRRPRDVTRRGEAALHGRGP